jgi:hypothetical protein
VSDDDDCPCYECDRVRDAHRTAIDLVLAHLRQAAKIWTGQEVDPGNVLRLTTTNVEAMRNWTPEHAAEVLRETKGATK